MNSNSAHNPLRTAWSLGDRFIIQYSGNFGIGHDVETIIGAMEALKNDDGILWVIVGDGVMKPVIEAYVKEHQILNVVLKPYQPRETLGQLISLGDMHLVLMVPGFEGIILPSKLYGILAAGRPVVFVGPEKSEIARIIQEEDCGFVVVNGDSKDLVRIITKLRNDSALTQQLGNRGRVALESKYSMQQACQSWHTMLHNVVKSKEIKQ